jgi:hypothetical protein
MDGDRRNLAGSPSRRSVLKDSADSGEAATTRADLTLLSLCAACSQILRGLCGGT